MASVSLFWGWGTTRHSLRAGSSSRQIDDLRLLEGGLLLRRAARQEIRHDRGGGGPLPLLASGRVRRQLRVVLAREELDLLLRRRPEPILPIKHYKDGESVACFVLGAGGESRVAARNEVEVLAERRVEDPEGWGPLRVFFR